MLRNQPTKLLLPAACGLAILLPHIALAQAPAPPAQPAPASSAAGLDALSDDKLLNELASRGLNNLLDRAFETSNIPASKRDAIRTIVALKQLSDPQSRLTVPQRRQLVQKIAAGL